MRIKHGWISAACVSVACVALAAPQALAASTWGPPQEVSPQFGRALQVSDDGQVMAWIRTNRATVGVPNGPVLTATYRGVKKGWSQAGQMPGTAETTGLQLSADGKAALVVSEVGLGVAKAQGAEGWSAPTVLCTETKVLFAQMASDAQTVVWVNETYVPAPPNPYGYPQPPVPVRTLKSRTVDRDGQWGAETVVGQIDPASSLYVATQAALSADGKTLVWLAEGKSLVAAVRGDAGTWSPPKVIRTYGGGPEFFNLRLAAKGERLVWSRASVDGIFTSTRTGSNWSPVSNVTVDSAKSFALSPNAKTVAWGAENGKIEIASLINGQWRSVASIGSGRAMSPAVILGKKTVVWINGADDVLRSATLKAGTWSRAGTVSKEAFEAVLSRDGKTLAWSQTSKMRILSSKR